MLKPEKNYEFRKRMLKVHKENMRREDILPAKDEVELRDGVTICIAQNADEVISTAAWDLAEYLYTSMNVSAMVKKSSMPLETGFCINLSLAADSAVTLNEANGYRGFRIDTTDSSINVYGFDSRGVGQGIYYLEDLMTFRKAPYLKKCTIEKKPMYGPQMVHSGYGLDEFPNEHLSAIAHEGRDAILIFVKDVDITPYGYLDFNELIYRASRYGLDVYAYSYLKHQMHPDDAGAEAYYENSYGKLFKNCPGLKGVIMVGESMQFPSRDERSGNVTIVDNIPNGNINSGWFPCRDYPDLINLIKRIVRKYRQDADIVLYTYNFGWQDEKARLDLINILPTDISLLVPFETHHTYELEDIVEGTTDYTLAFVGPGRFFKSEAEIAKKRGIRLYSMTNTGGMAWDIGVTPYEPFPYQWLKRYDAMQKMHNECGLSGIMESHHYGFYPSFISKLSKMVFFKPNENPGKILNQILASEFGEENLPLVDQAMKKWSEAITYYPPTIAEQYGAFRVGPTYPFCLERECKIPQAPYSMFGNGICFHRHFDKNDGLTTITSARVHTEQRLLEKMRDTFKEGLEILKQTKTRNEELSRLINMGEFILRTIITGVNAKKFYILKCAFYYEIDKTKLENILNDMEEIVYTEMENVKSTVEFVRLDSRLGWEPSMEYMTDESHLNWKIRQLEYLLGTEIKNARGSLAFAKRD